MVAQVELGWVLSGFDRALVDVARRRAWLWSLPAGDLYGEVFRTAYAFGGDTWAASSGRLLLAHGVMDWPEWAAAGEPSGTYSRYVKSVLITSRRRRYQSTSCPSRTWSCAACRAWT